MDAEQQVQELVRNVDQSRLQVDCLIDALNEQGALYDQQSRAAVIRMRGWILNAFSRHGIPNDGLSYVLEELESSIDPYTTAAAARALTQVSDSPHVIAFLQKGLENMRYRDDKVCFTHYGAYSTSIDDLTAREEILNTLNVLREREQHASNAVSCCGSPPIEDRVAGQDKSSESFCHSKADASSIDIGECRLQDQDENILIYRDFFCRAPTILVFFYTRCDNPHKCPKTMVKLCKLQTEIEDLAIQTAAITYDPKYDTPQRLSAYGRSYGLRTGDRHRLFRTVDGFDAMQRFFDLGVGRSGSIVNRHQIEAFVIDTKGMVALAARRLQWSPHELMTAAKRLSSIG
jgi:protein SCO1/2